MSRRNALNPTQQTSSVLPVHENETGMATLGLASVDAQLTHGSDSVYQTEVVQNNPSDLMDLSHPKSVMNKIGNDYRLNEKQMIAYRIITKNFIQKMIVKQHTHLNPLSMLITGPGGTGKTYVVQAVKSVMDHYCCGHIICYLAPTGSAANLIEGMTIHKGLGIKIHSWNKGKGNREPGESQQDYSVVIGVKNRTELWDEWRHVEFLLIDETSLLSLQLLAEIDHALRFAKEQPDICFGGVTMIFAGDFYQYPPVGGSPLYTPISPYARQTNEEIQKRLGRLAWKTINCVVNFTEQKRMEKDVQYGDAVARLCV